MALSIGPGWTDPRIAVLKKLWLAGQSSSQIAKALGGGITRNAVIGKLHRLGLSGRGMPTDPDAGRTYARKPVAPKVKRDTVASTNQAKGALARRGEGRVPYRPPVEPAPIPVTVDSPNARPWMERRGGECKWPLGERGAIMSCCNPVWRGGFCEGHARQGYDLTVKRDAYRVAKGTHSTLEKAALWHTRHERLDTYHHKTDRRVARPTTAWDEARSAA